MFNAATIVDVWRPNENVKASVYDAAAVFVGSVLMALSAQIAVGWPVPFTGQTFAVLMAGMLLGPTRGSLCVLLYLLEGALGLPVFSQGRAGLFMFFGPTGGYLVGFIAAAYISGWLSQKGWSKTVLGTIAAMVAGDSVLFIFGLCWLMVWTKSANVLAVGLYPFIVGDILKIALATAILPSSWKILSRFQRHSND